MTTDRPIAAPTKIECEGNRDRCTGDACPIFGTAMVKTFRDGKRRVRGCDDPTARGARNKRKGGSKQAAAVRALGIPRSNLSPGHEEFLGGAVRVEVKAGRQVGPIETRYSDYEAQSEAARPVGDHRPFCAIAMPDGWSDGIVLVRLSNVHEFAAAIVEMWGAA